VKLVGFSDNVLAEFFAIITAPGILPDFTADMNSVSMAGIMFVFADELLSIARDPIL
jgi:hypothetical protein